MTEYVKINQVLPQNIFEEFEGIINTEDRDNLIRALRTAGWTLEAISTAAKVTRERVRQISVKEPEDASFKLPIEIPEPPVREEKAKPVYIEPTPATLERLLELQPYAQLVRANGKKYREEGEEYTKLLNHAHMVEGVTLYRLAKRLGVTHGALRFRLVRYGYKKPLTATSKVYKAIIAENRVR